MQRKAPTYLLALLITGGGLAALAACTTDQPRVHSAALSTAPFDQYRTFSFGDVESAPAETHTTGHSDEVQRRAREAITDSLTAKGYALAEKKGDFTVMVGTGRAQKNTVRRPSHADWLDENEDEDFTVGALVIDIFDGSNDGQIWHGASRVEVDPNKVDPNLVRRSVQDVLARFPAARHAALSIDDAAIGGEP